MAYDNRALHGVGGWLAFYVIVLCVLQPLRVAAEAYGSYNLAQGAATFGTGWPVIRNAELALNVLVIAGGWFIAWRLVKRPVWQSVRIAIAGMWMLGLGLTAVDLLLVSLFGSMSFAGLLAASATIVVQNILSATIWTAYLLRSERVANTYRKDADEAELGEVFS